MSSLLVLVADSRVKWNRDEPIRTWVGQRMKIVFDENGKPFCPDPAMGPKEILEAVLKETGQPRSGSMYAEIVRSASLARCIDPAFVRLRDTLREWYGPPDEPGPFA